MANHCGPSSLRGGGGGGVLGVVGDSAGMLDEGSKGIRLNNRPKIGFSSGCDKGDSLGQSTSVAITMRTMLTDTLLERLVALNAERAAEKAKGTIRWLRSEFQAKGAVPEKKPEQATLVGVEDEETETAVAAVPATRLAWPKELPEQVRLVAQALADARVPLTEDAIATRF